jgi:hypothetical protein
VKQREPSGALVWLLGAVVAVLALFSRRPSPRLPAGVDAEDLQAGYERSDMRPAVVLAGAAALTIIMAGVLVAVTFFETSLTGVPPVVSAPSDLIGGLSAAPRPTPPAPQLEAQPGQSLQPYMAAEQAKLASYRWVDRANGIAAIPIDRAMDVIVQQGLPSRPSSTARDTGSASPSSASSGRVEEAYP